MGAGDKGIEGCTEDGVDALNAERECVRYDGSGKTMRGASLAFSSGIPGFQQKQQTRVMYGEEKAK